MSIYSTTRIPPRKLTSVRSELNDDMHRNNARFENRLEVEKKQYEKARKVTEDDIKHQKLLLQQSMQKIRQKSAKRISLDGSFSKSCDARLEKLALESQRSYHDAKIKAFVQDKDWEVKASPARNRSISIASNRKVSKELRDIDRIQNAHLQATNDVEEQKITALDLAVEGIEPTNNLSDMKLTDESSRQRPHTSRADFFNAMSVPKHQKTSVRSMRAKIRDDIEKTSISLGIIDSADKSPRIRKTSSGMPPISVKKQAKVRAATALPRKTSHSVIIVHSDY